MLPHCTRRQILRAGLAAGTIFAAWPKLVQAHQKDGGLYWSAYQAEDKTYGMAMVGSNGEIVFEKTLADRGHSAAVSPIFGHLAVTERRPGWYGEIWEVSSGQKVTDLKLPEGRHFYGHALYVGDRLYTTENAYEEERGVIGIWDVSNGYQRIGELDAGGIGPHEIVSMPTGRILVVASGGILTHPDEGRLKLNLPEMSPRLNYIDSLTGETIQCWEPPKQWHKASIRHLCVNAHGDVYFGMQYQGSTKEKAPLFGMARKDGNVIIANVPSKSQFASKNYCGSVELDQSQTIAAASTPRGNRVMFFRTNDGRYISEVEIKDACGICGLNQPGQFLISSGEGGIYHYNVLKDELVLKKEHNRRWDNHISLIAL